MWTISLVSLTLALPAPEVNWLKDYEQATGRAIKQKKDLFIVFQEKEELQDVLSDPEVVKKLKSHVCLRLPASYEYEGKRLLDYPALADMMGKPGFTIISMHDDKLPTHWQAISAHPFVASRYRWAPAYGVEQVKLILDLPAKATLSQRSMMYAVCVHPEQPQSVYGECPAAFLAHAQAHSQQQAQTQRQHHANLGAALSRLQSETGTGLGGASEVVAESWGRFVGGENVLEASFSCIDAWRHSPGHWRSVAGRHRFFGYDIAQGADGTWYATGIFAN
jgi:hypothetical protein